MADEPRKVPVRVKVQDKRKLHATEEAAAAEPAEPARTAVATDAQPEPSTDAQPSTDPVAGGPPASADETAEPDYLDALMRLQAEFDNYRKRMMREQASLERRGAARVLERLLPVLDNFEKAIAHGDGGEGVALVHKQLVEALEQEGLEEIPAENRAFDPSIHEAVDSHEDPDVDEPMVRSVYRRGYRSGDRLLRPSMVSVARPAEPGSSEGEG